MKSLLAGGIYRVLRASGHENADGMRRKRKACWHIAQRAVGKHLAPCVTERETEFLWLDGVIDRKQQQCAVRASPQ